MYNTKVIKIKEKFSFTDTLLTNKNKILLPNKIIITPKTKSNIQNNAFAFIENNFFNKINPRPMVKKIMAGKINSL